MTEITEKWARGAPAGAELDRVCAGFMGLRVGGDIVLYADEKMGRLPEFSRRWSAAGPLLEAMQCCEVSQTHIDKWRCSVEGISDKYYGKFIAEIQYSPTPQLAIARACAVLVARGISRYDLKP